MNGSSCSLNAESGGWAFALLARYTRLLMTLIQSPGTATTRLMKLLSDCLGVGVSHGCPSPGSLVFPHWFSDGSAPCGGLNTTMSPRLGSPKCGPRRFTRTRCPTFSVGTIDGLGIRNGLTRNFWMPKASPIATPTITKNSMTELVELFLRFPSRSFSVATAVLRGWAQHQEPRVSESSASESPSAGALSASPP